MWPLDLRAHQVLKLPEEAGIAWAAFDAGWYRRRYPQAVEQAGSDAALLLQYHLEQGQQQGHSPNRFFDEAWHRRAYPQIAAGIAAGKHASAFDAYCRGGCLDRSPHWLFDELAYRDRYPELSADTLLASGLVNGYDHYLRIGSQERRVGHALFDPAVYLAHVPAGDGTTASAQGAFTHYLQRVECGEPELPTSLYFDPVWYLQRYPAVAEALRLGIWQAGLQHYLGNETPTVFDPLEAFSEAHYLALDPGLQKAIDSRQFRNGYAHFLKFGADELRSPCAAVDLAWYAVQPRVRDDVAQGLAPTAFAHWLSIGRRGGLKSAAPERSFLAHAPDTSASSDRSGNRFGNVTYSDDASAVEPGDEGRVGWLQQIAATLLPNAGRFGHAFDRPSAPAVSVVMPVRNGFAGTLATLASLQGSSGGCLEVIIVDRGSTDETRAITDYVHGVRLLRFETDIGWSQAANAGSLLATAPAILFLASEAHVAPGAVERARARLDADASAGAIGGMVVRPDGSIAQAGGILWRDGGVEDYQRGRSPLAPEASFVRPVDFCGAAFLLVRASVMASLEGFDPVFDTDGHAAMEFCARIIQAGGRVIYDPSVVVFHDDRGQQAAQAGAHFRARHAALLTERLTAEGRRTVFARQVGPPPPRLLFIEDTVPLRRIGSGFVRSNDMVRAMAGLGWQVTVFPVNGCLHDPAHVFGNMPDSVEVMHDCAVDGFEAFMAGRVGYYDCIWIVRTHNLHAIHPALSRLIPDTSARPCIILDTEALAPLRLAEQRRLQAVPYDVDAALAAHFVHVEICDAVVAVCAAEATVLRERGIGPVSVVGHMIEPKPTPRPHAKRSGMLFVGAIHTPDSPNLDSLIWFVEAVLPLIEAELAWETRLTIVGYMAPGIEPERFAQHPRITLRSTVADLRPLYDSHRVFVAPTRYAAGTPYKVFEAASYGLPVVATTLLRRQLGWEEAEAIAAADADDPRAFAAAVVTLYRQEAVWQGIRDGALRRIAQDNDQAGFVHALSDVLSAAKRDDLADGVGSLDRPADFAGAAMAKHDRDPDRE